MTVVFEAASIVLVLLGTAFFVSGTVGLLRFPDVYSRLHSLTKCDNLGLGLVALGLMPQVPSGWLALKILGTWALVLMASGTAAHLIARRARLTRADEEKGMRE